MGKCRFDLSEDCHKKDCLACVLDKIRAEIEQIVSRYTISRERGAIGQVEWSDRLIKESEVLEILDKYKAESEIHCNCTDAEIAKSFIEDVEAVKELLPQAEREDMDASSN